MLSDKELEAIQSATVVQEFEIDGHKYTDRPLHRVALPKQPEYDELKVATLTGLKEYIDVHGAAPEGSRMIAHVVNYQQVRLISAPFGEYFQRHDFATATSEWPSGLQFGQFLDLETFVIQLLALYVDSDDRDETLSLVSNIRDEEIRTASDDGVTQVVTSRSGIARVEAVPVTNPRVLAPFRTFREIEQPESPFILRIRKEQTGMKAGLFEADGGAWKIKAVERIKGWLSENLPESVQVIG